MSMVSRRMSIWAAIAAMLIIAAGAILSGNATAQGNVGNLATDKAALQALYNSTNGNNWTNNSGWDFTTDPSSSWYGVTVADGRVTRLQLGNNNLNGSLPSELGNLTELTHLYLNDNGYLNGSIPAELGDLSKLTDLSLGNNNFSGPIPSELGDLSKLERLYLRENALSGSIPSELGSLFDLEEMELHNNNLSGSIPSELGNLTNLTILQLSGNSLTGSIPRELGEMSQMESLAVAGNNLSGVLPSELGGMTNVVVLLLENNDFYGPIPSSFTGMSNVFLISMYGNSICIPSSDTTLATWYNNIQQRNPNSLRSCGSPPAAPSALTATLNAVGDGVNLVWTDPQDTDIKGWQYRQKEGSGDYDDWVIIAGSIATTTTLSVAGLTIGQTYTIQVRAFSNDGDGASSEVSVAILIDYDKDDDGLIEIGNLAQLNAVRWDLNGDGSPDDSTDSGNYSQAFVHRLQDMGCPDSGCVGYELDADLGFDTNSNGETDAGDAYWNGGSGWAPIGASNAEFKAVFEGNGHTIGNLFIKGSASDYLGLFGATGSGSNLRKLGLLNVSINGSSDDDHVGGLVGRNRGTISASYVTGSVRGNNDVGGLVGDNSHGTISVSYSTMSVFGGDNVGGLTGDNSRGTISASYATGPVAGVDNVGGLAGDNFNSAISASFATGPVSGASDVGGLLGRSDSGSTVASSYWDTESSGQSASAGGVGKSTAELQAPTWNTGIYSTWSAGQWDFGTEAQYPALKTDFDGNGTSTWQEFGKQRTDYDADNDGLIEIGNLSELNAIRWDLNGNGVADDSDDNASYWAVFPNPASNMGCPASGCTGYELDADLDFDTNNNGLADAGDEHWNGGNGWMPIGYFTSNADTEFDAVFEGNGHTISNLFINGSGSNYLGLFGAAESASHIRNLGLENIQVDASGGGDRVGGLAGFHRGTVSATYTTGSVRGNDHVGGLVGEGSHGTIAASYAVVSVAGDDNVGGLVGEGSHGTIRDSYATGPVTGDDKVGGLSGVGFKSTITASYSTGRITGAGRVGGLLGSSDSGTVVTASYWDTETSGQSDSAGGVGKTTAELRGPTSNTGIYSSWEPGQWDFATQVHYPALRSDFNGDGIAIAGEFGGQVIDYDSDQDGLIEVANLAQLNAIRLDPDGDGGVADADAVSYAAAFPNADGPLSCPASGCVGYELTADLNLDTNDNGRADSGDAYWNGGAGWDPIDGYSGILEGNGHAIKNLHVNRAGSDAAGLFGELTNEAEVRNLGLSNVDITSGGDAGAFAGRMVKSGIIRGYATGTVTGHGDDASVGGLVGKASGHASRKGAIRDSYSLVAVTVSGDDTTAGGLAGTLSASDNSQPWIVHSFAAGPIQAMEPDLAGGLVGDAETDFAWVSHSYWDRETSGWDTSAVGGRETQDRLQAPKTTRNIFARWGSSIWDFGDHSQYPALKYDTNGDNVATVAEFGDQTRTATIPAIDLDWDNDGLIEINGANNDEIKAKLNAIRWDLNGDGTPSSNADDYWDAFTGGTSSTMSCVGVPCHGYELMGDVNLNQELWDPIGNLESGKWDATFRGNGYTVSHLNALSSSGKNTGLFGETTHRSVIEGVHIYSADVESYGGNNDDNRQNSAGALVGFNRGIVRESGLSYIWGDICSISGRNVSGGLVGGNEGIVERSWSNCDDINSKKGGGGLVGFNHPGGIVRDSWADGLVIVDRKGWKKGALIGRNFGEVDKSFSLGQTKRDNTYHGPLTGQQGGTVTDSYYVGHDYDEKYGGTHLKDEEMRTPRPSEPSFFADWDLDLWDLGDETQYSVLRADTDEDGYKTTWEIGSQRPSDFFQHEPAFVDGNAAHNIWREGLSLRFRKADGDVNIRVDGIGYRIAQKGEACHEWVAGGRVMVGETNGRATLSEDNGVYTLVLDRADLWAFRPNGRVCVDVNFVNTAGKKSDARRYRDIQMPGGEVPRSKPIKKAEAIISDGSVALWFDTNSYDWVKGVGYRVAITGDACESWEVGEGSFKPGDEIGGAVLTEVNGLWRLALPVGEGYIMEPNRRYCVDVTAFNDDGWAGTGRRWRSFVTGN